MNQTNQIILNELQLCDYELISNGSLYPLQGFMTEAQYQSVLKQMQLNNQPFGLPVYLSVKKELVQKQQLSLGQTIQLKDKFNNLLCLMNIESIYQPNLQEECIDSLGSDDINHPFVQIIKENVDCVYIGGKFEQVQENNLHYDYQDLRVTPNEAKKYFQQNNWQTIVGFQTRNPMHKSHYYLTLDALKQTGDDNAKLLLNPTVGITQKSDINYHTRVKCYKKILQYYQKDQVKLVLLNLSMRMAGPREALQHAIIRQNYGCTHFIVGRDHAGPSSKTQYNQPFYGPYDAHQLLKKFENQLKIKLIYSKAIDYVPQLDKYLSETEIMQNNYKSQNISGTLLRDLLRKQQKIPQWFTFKEVQEELEKDQEFLPKYKKGFSVYLVGLSGAGKTTISRALQYKFNEIFSGRTIDVLDADEIRQNLSEGLGFSKEDRSKNVQRIGYLTSKIVKNGGIAIVANIAPYLQDRKINKEEILKYGGFFQVWVNTPVEECEKRDLKGLYAKFRKDPNSIKLTGVNDPFEQPTESEIIIDGKQPIQKSLDQIIQYLTNENYIFNQPQPIINNNLNQKFCFITGITGQDGSYLSEYLLSQEYKVFALKRKSSLDQEIHCFRIIDIIDKLTIFEGDITNQLQIQQILKQIKSLIANNTLEIYHLAAQSDVHYSFMQHCEVNQINYYGTLNILESLKQLDMIQQVKLYNAATSEMFGNEKAPQNEQTPFNPRSPYAISKYAAFQAVKNFRESYKFFGVSGILFNHESPKRGENFILYKIIKAAVRIAGQKQNILYLGNLYSKRDIGYCKDYVKAMHKMLQLQNPEDLVIGSGNSYQIKELVELVFNTLLIKIQWKGQGQNEIGYNENGQEIIKIDPSLYRELEVNELQADTKKAYEKMQWKNETSIQQLINIMIKSEKKKPDYKLAFQILN